MSRIKHHSKLALSERKLIALWKRQGFSIRECGRRLGRSHSTVVRELKRNRFKKGVYEPLNAQGKAESRKKKAWGAKQPLKNPWVYAFVIDGLRQGWSPEQIAGRLRHDHPRDKSWWICHETIYRFIYHPDNQEKGWWEYLRRKQKRRRKKAGRKAHRVRIPDRVSIHQRPRVVDRRKQPGHWEGDSIVGKDYQNGLHTEYERVFSFTRIEKLDKLDAKNTLRAQRKIFEPLPKNLRRSTTLDNGMEMVFHRWLRKRLGMKTYFADPYAS